MLAISIYLTLSYIAIFNIVISWPNSKVNTISIGLSNDRNPVSKIFFPFGKFYMIISITMAPKPYIEPLALEELKLQGRKKYDGVVFSRYSWVECFANDLSIFWA